jgi:WD40 repeat protein
VKGLQSINNLLVSGGASKQLFVWNMQTGQKLHTVYHQPSTIQYLYADVTKIVTAGREDQPVVVGYW